VGGVSVGTGAYFVIVDGRATPTHAPRRSSEATLALSATW
jgi:hypothetical protein